MADPPPGELADLAGRYADAVLRGDAGRFSAAWTSFELVYRGPLDVSGRLYPQRPEPEAG